MIIFWFLMLLLFVMTLLWRVRMVWSLALIQPTLKGQVTFLKLRRQCAWQWLFLWLLLWVFKIRFQAKNASIYKYWRQDYCSLQDLTRAKICKYFFGCNTKTRVRIQSRVAMCFGDENKKFVKKVNHKIASFTCYTMLHQSHSQYLQTKYQKCFICACGYIFESLKCGYTNDVLYTFQLKGTNMQVLVAIQSL